MIDTPLCINLAKWLFIILSVSMLILSIVMNLLEPYLPVIITRTFRYGKFSSAQKSKLVEKCELPKAYFKHFYLTAFVFSIAVFYFVIQNYLENTVTPLWLINVLDIICGCGRKATVSRSSVFIAITLLQIQIIKRLIETHYISVFAKKSKMNVVHYIIGMIFYPGVLAIILSEAPGFVFNEINEEEMTNTMLWSDICFIDLTAVIVFCYVCYHQFVCTRILGNLRKMKHAESSSDYKIPEGDWFEYVSSPHCLTEIFMYSALTLLLRNNSSIIYVWFWVVCNQMETMYLTHKWYIHKFEDFPKQRKIYIPFVF